MNVLVAPIAALLIGLFVRSRLMAAILFLCIEALFFTFQTLVVLLAWMAGQGGFGEAAERGAFGAAPTGFPISFDEGEVWAYGLVNLGLIVLGAAITVAIAALRERLRRRSVRPALDGVS
jgi:hypothetical protein